MMQLVADFYAHIFVFLSDVMDWVTEKRRKRLLDSFNEDLFQKFDDQIARIRDKSGMIRNLAAQSSRAEQRVTTLTLEDLNRDVRLGIQGAERRHAEMVYFAERIEKDLAEQRRAGQQFKVDDQAFEQLASRLTQSVFNMLQDKALGWIGDMRSTNGGKLQLLDFKNKRQRYSIKPFRLRLGRLTRAFYFFGLSTQYEIGSMLLISSFISYFAHLAPPCYSTAQFI